MRVAPVARRLLCTSSADRLSSLLPHASLHSAYHQGHRKFVYRHDDEPVDLASVLVTQNNILHSASVHPDLPLSAAKSLVLAVLDEYEGARALAALPGLCAWVAAMEPAALEDEFGADAAGAAVAIALGRPRPGHSVLGQGTFRAATPAWTALAGRYAESDAAEECALYRAAGGVDRGVQHMANTDAAYIADSGGAMALFEFPSK